jgi:1,4-alpha-glucan branching enzyme
MGQEFLEDKQWNWDPADTSHLIWWAGLLTGSDSAMVNHLQFTKDAIGLRWDQPALRGDNVNPFHVHDQNRVIAYHRWLEVTGQDVIIVVTLAENTWYDYQIGFPYAGGWTEIFNSATPMVRAIRRQSLRIRRGKPAASRPRRAPAPWLR